MAVLYKFDKKYFCFFEKDKYDFGSWTDSESGNDVNFEIWESRVD